MSRLAVARRQWRLRVALCEVLFALAVELVALLIAPVPSGLIGALTFAAGQAGKAIRFARARRWPPSWRAPRDLHSARANLFTPRAEIRVFRFKLHDAARRYLTSI